MTCKVTRPDPTHHSARPPSPLPDRPRTLIDRRYDQAMTPAQRAQVRQLLIEGAARGGGLNMSLAPDGMGVFHEFLPRGVAPTGPPPRAPPAPAPPAPAPPAPAPPAPAPPVPAPPARTEIRTAPSDVVALISAAVARGGGADLWFDEREGAWRHELVAADARTGARAHAHEVMQYRPVSAHQTYYEQTLFFAATGARVRLHECARCGEMADCRRCAACSAVHYCNRVCQQRDWNAHRAACVAARAAARPASV